MKACGWQKHCYSPSPCFTTVLALLAETSCLKYRFSCSQGRAFIWHQAQWGLIHDCVPPPLACPPSQHWQLEHLEEEFCSSSSSGLGFAKQSYPHHRLHRWNLDWVNLHLKQQFLVSCCTSVQHSMLSWACSPISIPSLMQDVTRNIPGKICHVKHWTAQVRISLLLNALSWVKTQMNAWRDSLVFKSQLYQLVRKVIQP